VASGEAGCNRGVLGDLSSYARAASARFTGPSRSLKRAVIVAVPGVRMVQVPADEVVDVIAVRDGVVPAARPVHVTRNVGAAGVRGRARRRVRSVDADCALVDVAGVGVVQMPVVQVIGVAAVCDRRMTAAGTVGVSVVGVNGVVAHGDSSLS
jgi:hypothetical protein